MGIWDNLACDEVLTEDEEFNLAARVQKGDINARNQLVMKSIRYALKLANKYRNTDVEMDDLISAAIMGLLISANSYKPNRGTRFVVYSARGISQSLIREINFHYHVVSMSKDDETISFDLNMMEKAMPENESNEVIESVAKENGLPYERVEAVHTASKNSVISVDGKAEDFENVDIKSNLISAEEEALFNLDYETICDMVDNLPKEYEREIMYMTFGLNGYDIISGEEIGKLFGRTKAWVSQIKKKCINYIRKEMREDGLVA